MLRRLSLILRLDLGDILVLLGIFYFNVRFLLVDFHHFWIFMCKMSAVSAQFMNENFLCSLVIACMICFLSTLFNESAVRTKCHDYVRRQTY